MQIVGKDAAFVGQLDIGSPKKQPINLIFDTGSEYLVVTSNLCSDETAGEFSFKKYSEELKKVVKREKTSGRCQSQAYDQSLSDSSKVML